MTSRMPPITTHESATLNTGHHCRSMKSITPPPKKPAASERSVGEIAERAAEDEPEGDGARAAGDRAALPQQENHDTQRQDGDDRDPHRRPG